MEMTLEQRVGIVKANLDRDVSTAEAQGFVEVSVDPYLAEAVELGQIILKVADRVDLVEDLMNAMSDGLNRLMALPKAA